MESWYTRADLWVIFAYLAGMLLVAWRVSDKSRDAEGYTVGNRAMPGWAVGISVLATFTSSISFLGLPATTYAENWNRFVFSLTLPAAALIAVIWLVPLYREGVRFSAYEFLESRFGYWARAYAVVSYVALQIVRVANVLLLVALAVAPMLGWSIVGTIILLGVIVIVYDTLGGIQAVIWTDVMQVVILLVGALWCLAVLVGGAEGGVQGFFESIPADRVSWGVWDKEAETSLPWWNVGTLAHSTVLVVLIYGVTENLRNYGTDQNYVQRVLAARSTHEASRSIWIGAWAYLPISAMFCLIGTALWLHYPTPPVVDGAAITAEKVFPHFIQTELPAPIAGLVIGAIMAAAMSSVDSSLNSSSTVLFIDVVRRWRLAPRVSDIVVLRGTTILLGILGTWLAVRFYQVFLAESARIMDIWWKYAGVAGGGMFGLFLLAWLAPRTPRWAAALGVIASVPVLFWGLGIRIKFVALLGWDLTPQKVLYGSLVGVAGTIAVIAVGLTGLLLVRLGIATPNQSRDPSGE